MSNILIGGGSGLIGQRLSELLTQKGHTVLHLSRHKRPNATYKTYQWDLASATIEAEAIQSVDYVINLAGAGIADKRWTTKRKKLIIDSRVDSTRLLLNSFQKFNHFPKAFISGAAIGYYGNRGDSILKEDSPPGSGFLAESCIAWENAIKEVIDFGIRTVAFRIGIVLSTKGGALEKMLLPYKFGTGTYFGNGQQWYAWIHIDDLCRMIVAAIENERMQGFYNGVSPNPHRNKDLTAIIGEALGKKVVLIPAPAFALRAGMGEMADVVLNSTRAVADKVIQTGFEFEYPELKGALKDILKKKV